MGKQGDIELLAVDVAEAYKGSVHLALFGLAMICTAYNLGACASRPTFRLLGNSLVYGVLAGYEVMQVRRHWGRVGQVVC